MAYYEIPEKPRYEPEVRRLEPRDFAHAVTVFNPLLGRLVENDAAIKAVLDAHESATDAHAELRNAIAELDARVAMIELRYNTNVTGNPYAVTFENLTGLNVAGVWNTGLKRIEF